MHSNERLLVAVVFCSQLVCMHFGSWDTAKEWSVSMPVGEDIQVRDFHRSVYFI